MELHLPESHIWWDWSVVNFVCIPILFISHTFTLCHWHHLPWWPHQVFWPRVIIYRRHMATALLQRRHGVVSIDPWPRTCFLYRSHACCIRCIWWKRGQRNLHFRCHHYQWVWGEGGGMWRVAHLSNLKYIRFCCVVNSKSHNIRLCFVYLQFQFQLNLMKIMIWLQHHFVSL